MAAFISLRTRGHLALLLSFAAAIASSAQDSSLPRNPDSQKSTASDLVFRQNVRRVVVDVVVSDDDGKPVRGLTEQDFSITEDGKPQRIRSFDVHDFDSHSDSLPKLPLLPANTFVNVPAGPERGPLYVLLLDLVDMSADDQPHAREALLKFVAAKPEGTRFAVFVFSDGLHLVQGFTEDRNRLAAAIDPKNPRSHIPRIFLYTDNFQPYASTPRLFINIARFLGELPGRKNLIWLSSSFPSAIMPSTNEFVEGLTMKEEIEEATDTLARAQVAVYPVDVRGLVVADPADHAALNNSYLTEQEIATSTGGRAFFNTNDLTAAINKATDSGAHYYTLTYSPTNQTYNGRMRHIRLDLRKGGYHLEYRRSYYGNPKSAPPDLRPAADLQPIMVSVAADSLLPNMQHGAPLAHQLLFRAHVHALGPPAKATAEQMANLSDSIRVRRKDPDKPRHPIKLQTFEIDYTVAARYPTLEVAAAAYDEDGKIMNVAVHRAAEGDHEMSVKPRQDGIYRLDQQIDVPVGAVSLRLAVRDVATDNIGAMEISLPLGHDEQVADSQLRRAGDSIIVQVP